MEMSTRIYCERCNTPCKVTGPKNPNAKMLRRSREPKGLCVNCAVHDWLKNTYPANVLLAKSGPRTLAHPHIQEQFAQIMRVGLADAVPDEINWELIIENWDLPFPHKVKPSSANPCSQFELEEIATGKRPGLAGLAGLGDAPKRQTVCGKDLLITSFSQLNDLDPGLGDDLEKCLTDHHKKTKDTGQRELFE